MMKDELAGATARETNYFNQLKVMEGEKVRNGSANELAKHTEEVRRLRETIVRNFWLAVIKLLVGPRKRYCQRGQRVAFECEH